MVKESPLESEAIKVFLVVGLDGSVRLSLIALANWSVGSALAISSSKESSCSMHVAKSFAPTPERLATRKGSDR